MIRLALVDDHPVMRHGLRSLLDTQPDLRVVAETGDPDETLRIVADDFPDVVLMDLDLGKGEVDGAQLTRLILAERPEIRVIAFTAYDSDADIVRMVEAGAVGFLVKDSRPSALFSAIRQAAEGSAALAGPIAARLLHRIHRPDDALTPRELEVLERVAAGLSNRDLARHLLVSEATVKTHLHHAFTKLGVDSRQAAVAAAVRRGLIRMPG